MSDKTYNGWTNYETWNVKLWIDNDGSGSFWEEQADEALKRASDDDEARNLLAESLKSMFDEQMPEVQGCYADLLNAALSEVNWYEIAESMVNDAKERAEV